MKSLFRNPTFGIATLLICISWVAAMLAGYQSGFNRGMDAATEASVEVRRLREVSTVTYDVSHLWGWFVPLSSGVDSESYFPILLLHTSIDPDSWDDRDIQVEVWNPKQNLIISQTGRNHDAISDLLKKISGLREAYRSSVECELCYWCGHCMLDEFEPNYSRADSCRFCGARIGY